MSKLILQSLLCLCLFASVPVTGFAAEAGVMLSDLAIALGAKDLSRLRNLIDAQSMVYVASILRAPGYPKKDPLEILPDTTSPDSIRRVEERLFDRLGSGVEQNECREARRPGCAWAPEAVANGMLIEESEDSAMAAVDNKRGIRTWLLLKKESGRWRAWAVAESEREARLVASREFQESLVRVRRELPALMEAKAKARVESRQAKDEEYQKSMAGIEQRNRAEKAAKDAVECRILRMAVEEREAHPMSSVPPYRVLHLMLEVRNANSFAVLPKTWAVTFSRPDGAQVKTITLDHQGGGDALPLSADERKTLSLTARSLDEKYIAGWNNGTFSAKAELLNFERR